MRHKFIAPLVQEATLAKGGFLIAHILNREELVSQQLRRRFCGASLLDQGGARLFCLSTATGGGCNHEKSVSVGCCMHVDAAES